jgi:hypothetical protein
MKDVQDVRESIDRAAAAIGTAQTLVAEGKTVDLSGLDEGIATLCADVAALPKDRRTTIKMPLLGLVDGLNRLVDGIRSQHERLSAALNGTTSRRNAVSAYAKGPKGPPRGK